MRKRKKDFQSRKTMSWKQGFSSISKDTKQVLVSDRFFHNKKQNVKMCVVVFLLELHQLMNFCKAGFSTRFLCLKEFFLQHFPLYVPYLVYSFSCFSCAACILFLVWLYCWLLCIGFSPFLVFFTSFEIIFNSINFLKVSPSPLQFYCLFFNRFPVFNAVSWNFLEFFSFSLSFVYFLWIYFNFLVFN